MVRGSTYAAGATGLIAALAFILHAEAQGEAPDGEPEPSSSPAEQTPPEPTPEAPPTEPPLTDVAPPEATEPSEPPHASDAGAGGAEPTMPSEPLPPDPWQDEPPPTQTTTELLEADSIAIGPEYGQGATPLPGEEEEEEEDEDDGLPWGQGTLVPGIGFGFGFGSDYTVLSFSLGASYYFIDGFAAGLTLGDTIYFYSDELDEQFPGFSDEIPTNIFRITPTAQYVFYRHERFSPYVMAGVGPVFYNNGGGVVGEWLAGPGIYIGIVGPLALDLGVTFSSIFPEDKWEEAFSYQGQRVVACNITDSLCSFDISPRIGIALSF